MKFFLNSCCFGKLFILLLLVRDCYNFNINTMSSRENIIMAHKSITLSLQTNYLIILNYLIIFASPLYTKYNT